MTMNSTAHNRLFYTKFWLGIIPHRLSGQKQLSRVKCVLCYPNFWLVVILKSVCQFLITLNLQRIYLNLWCITLLIVFPKFHFFMHTKTNSPNIILLSERYLDLPVALHQISLSMECYNLICPDNSLNVNRGGLCIYHRETLPIRFLTLSH